MCQLVSFFCAENCCFISLQPKVHKSWVSWLPVLWVHSMELARCYPFSIWNFEVASRFLENVCTLFFKHCNLVVCGCCSSLALCPTFYHRFSYNCYLSSVQLGQHINHKTVVEKHLWTCFYCNCHSTINTSTLWYIARNMYKVIVTLLCILNMITLQLARDTPNCYVGVQG